MESTYKGILKTIEKALQKSCLAGIVCCFFMHIAPSSATSLFFLIIFEMAKFFHFAADEIAPHEPPRITVFGVTILNFWSNIGLFWGCLSDICLFFWGLSLFF